MEKYYGLNQWERIFLLKEADLDKRNRILDIFERSKDREDLKNRIKNDKTLRSTLFAGELLKDDTDFINSFLPKDHLNVEGEAGSVKCGNKNFQVYFNDDKGKEITKVGIINQGEINSRIFRSVGCIKGEFNLYGSDCGYDISFEGDYEVYARNGIILFEKRS